MSDLSKYVGRASQAGASPLAGRRLLLAAIAVSLVLWFVPWSNYLLYPIRLFVTFVHESGHAVAALATGGSVEGMAVHPDGSGVTYTRGSLLWQWVVLSGGYVGAAAFGAVMLHFGRLRSGHSGRMALTLAASLVGFAAVVWGHANPFTLAVGLLLAIGLGVASRRLSPQGASLAAAFLAVECCLDSLSDLRTLFVLTSAGSQENDAGFMAHAYLLPAGFWAILWAAIAMTLLALSLRSYLRATGAQSAASAGKPGVPALR